MITALRDIHSGWGLGLKEGEARQVDNLESFMEELAFRQIGLYELGRLTFGDLLVGSTFWAEHRARAKV